jgi:hypothetical protein
MSKNEYKITFRGEIIAIFTSVYAVQHIVVGYKNPTSTIAVYDRYKTVKAACSTMVERAASNSVNAYSLHSAFVIKALPGVTEITDATIIDSRDRLSGVTF